VEIVQQPTGSAQPPPDPAAEVAELRALLDRERERRIAAERLGEQAAAGLYDSVRAMRAAQGQLIDHVGRDGLVNELARSLRQDLDSAQLVERAAESVGRAVYADRCDVLLVDAEPAAAVRGSWSRTDEASALPRVGSFVDLPEPLTALLLEAAQHLSAVHVDDVESDERLTTEEAVDVEASLGTRSLAAVPVAVGDEVVGWMLLHSLAPRAWRSADLAMCTGMAHDLVVSLIQVRAFEQQRKSVNRLRELDRAKDAFISTVSHELRTPLASIVGYLELIAEGTMGEVSDGVAQGITVIERNVVRLRALVEDLLTLSAYDAEEVHLDLQPVDLAGLVERCRQALLPTMADSDISMAVLAAPGAPAAMGDPEQLEQLALNLLSNAVKFSHEHGRVEVRISGEGDEVVLVVADRGIGIPEAEQDRVFARFFRSSLAVTGEIQGTGLGLSLVHAVTERHRGTVTVQSAEGEGTTVTVRLPGSR
jgi:two-component system, OmpR family, phosphate regulon sensor histidine kinase PhoR